MNVTINGKTIETRFGMAFIREINKKYLSKDSISKEQYGVMFSYSFLDDENPEGIAEVIYYATAHIKIDRPTKADIDEFLECVDSLDKLCNELKAELQEGTLTKKAVKRGITIMNEREKTQKKQAARIIRCTKK